MTVKVKDIAGRFRGWTPSMDLLKEVGFEGLGPSGTTAGEIEVEKLCLSVHSTDRDCRMVAARGLSVAVHKLSPEFTRALEGLVVLAWDSDREVQHVARSALHIWERYPQVFCLGSLGEELPPLLVIPGVVCIEDRNINFIAPLRDYATGEPLRLGLSFLFNGCHESSNYAVVVSATEYQN